MFDQNLLPREALITIYKPFVRPYLDYGDVLFDCSIKHLTFHLLKNKNPYNTMLAFF